MNSREKEHEMFEKSFQRPKNFYSELTAEERWEIDKRLGILDWEGRYLTKEEKLRFNQHYK
jgi:hypothetical protein